jgi:hypothetical protein
MKNALKAVILSGAVFPGLGQTVLRRYKRGMVLMGVTFICLVVMVTLGTQKSMLILDEIQSAGGAVTIEAISKAAADASTASDSLIFNLVFFMMVFCWIFGIIDAYRIGRQKDNIPPS